MMIFTIEICKDRSTRLIAGNGDVLWCFPTLESARDSCIDWYAIPEIASERSTACHFPDSRVTVSSSSLVMVNSDRLIDSAA